MRSGTFSQQKKALILAERERVYSFITRIRNWPSWAAINTENTVFEFEKAPFGRGARVNWHSDDNAAEYFEITDAFVPEKLEFALSLSGQVLSGHLYLATDDETTRIYWTTQGTRSFYENIIHPFFQPRLGRFQQKGLESLKKALEKQK